MFEFAKICRACRAEKSNLLNLFVNDCENEPTLGEKFFACTSLYLDKSDQLPQCICYGCAKLLEQAFVFRLQCHNSDTEFKKFLLPPLKTENCSPLTEIVNATDEEQDQESIVEDEEVYLEEEKIEAEPEIEAVVMSEDSQPFSVQEVEPKKRKISDSNMRDKKRPFRCSECEKSFFTDKALVLHQKLHKKRTNSNAVIPSRRTLSCEKCGKQFTSVGAFENHQEIHQKEYNCTACGKEFSQARLLHRHMLYHGEFIYKCPDCDRPFKIKHKFVEHLRRIHQMELTRDQVRNLEAQAVSTDGVLLEVQIDAVKK